MHHHKLLNTVDQLLMSVDTMIISHQQREVPCLQVVAINALQQMLKEVTPQLQLIHQLLSYQLFRTFILESKFLQSINSPILPPNRLTKIQESSLLTKLTPTQESKLQMPPTPTQESLLLTNLAYIPNNQVSSSTTMFLRTLEPNTMMPSFKTLVSSFIFNNTQLTRSMPKLPLKETPLQITTISSRTQDSSTTSSNMPVNSVQWLSELHILT